MIKIEAIVREDKLEDVKQALQVFLLIILQPFSGLP